MSTLNNKKKRIVIVNRYFWPETFLVNYISQWLVSDGYAVTVFTGQPDYNPDAGIPTQATKQLWNDVEINRITLFRDKGRGIARNLNTQLFTLFAVFRVLFSRNVETVWCTTIPPVLQPFLLRLVTKLRGIKFVYFVQDIYPEILYSSGLLKPGVISNFLRRVDNFTLRHSDRVVTISNDMRDLLLEFGAKPETCSVIRSFSTEDTEQPVVGAQKVSSPVVFVFSGNLGQFQNLDALVELFSRCDPGLVQLKFLGNGREKEKLKALVATNNITNIEFYDVLPADQAFDFVRGCDVGIVTLSKDVYKYAFPAKTYTYLGAGLPLLVFIEDDSELVKIVSKRQIGQCVSWDSNIEVQLNAVLNTSNKFADYKRNVLDNTDDLWKQERGREEWLRLFKQMCEPSLMENTND